MSYWPTTKIQSLANTPSIDAFARWRVSQPTTLFDYASQYDIGPLFWDTSVVGAGSATHLPNQSATQLSTGSGTSGDSCVRQTFEYFRYQPGKSQLAVLTANIGAKKTGVRQRCGYYDAQNGVFFEQDATDLKVVTRTFTSGVAVDNAVAQSAWNVDKLDGTGPSGITLDTSDDNIYWADMEWLGVGQVRFGIYSPNGYPIVCHEFQNANALTVVYMTTANLPLRYEITNTGAAAGATTMTQICSTVISEGGAQYERAYEFGAANGIVTRAVTTRRAILSIRPKATFNSIVNRGKISPSGIDLTADTNDCFWELVYNPTFTGTPVWTSADANSITEFSTHGDAAAGAITGGIVIDSGYVPAGAEGARGSAQQPILNKYPLTLNAAGSGPKSLALVCTSFTGTSTDAGAIHWEEIR